MLLVACREVGVALVPMGRWGAGGSPSVGRFRSGLLGTAERRWWRMVSGWWRGRAGRGRDAGAG